MLSPYKPTMWLYIAVSSGLANVGGWTPLICMTPALPVAASYGAMLRAQFWRTLGISALEETPADEPEPDEPEPDEPEPPPVFTQTRAEPFLVHMRSTFIALL